MRWAGQRGYLELGAVRNIAPAGEPFLRRCIAGVKSFFCEKFSWSAGAGQQLALSWTLCQFSRARHGAMLTLSQAKVQTMNQIIDWMQNNWYEFGSLLAQLTIAFIALWFASKILRAMRAMQQQFGALLRLSMTNGLEEPSSESERAPRLTSAEAPSAVSTTMFAPAMEPPAAQPTAPPHRPTSYAAFEKPARTEAPSLSEELNGGTGAPMTATAVEAEHEPMSHEPTPYVAAPLTLPEEENNGSPIAAAGRGVVQWLQTPMAPKKRGPSPLRKVVRWLQAPVRS